MKEVPGLLETMYWNGHAIELWPYHLHRLQKGIQHFGLPADEDEIREKLLYHLSGIHTNTPQKVRLELQQEKISISLSSFTREPERQMRLGKAEGLIIDSRKATGLKTTERRLYQQAQEQAASKGWDDMILSNEKGHWVETSIFNLIWQDEHGRYYTPSEGEGCITGVMRNSLVDQDIITESVLYPESLDHAKAVWVCNALRGILSVREIEGRNYPVQPFIYSK